MPTLRSSTSEFGTRRAAAMKYAAEEISPGTFTFCPISRGFGTMEAVVPSVRTSAPKYRSISSEWFRDMTGSVTFVIPSAYNPASSTQDFTWADATGDS